ncbi:O-methyltransferase, family 2 [Rhypophila decipiens]|uniref:O-methyltransferase, family 2 n=1 Tax=Rhypophila decipiens TaxID=261697 RepID=A0AAN6Y806_9PEZI|nr:O-methyltransferase, family 2 [Rhypophila decipiens]
MSPAPQPRTVQLASSILEHTTILESFLHENGLPSPSFDPGTPPKLPLSPEVEKSLEMALSSLDELTALLMGPMGWLLNQIGHAFDLASLHAMYRYKVPSKFPVGSKIPIRALSKLCVSSASGEGVDKGTVADSEDKMTRLMQHAVSNYLLLQESPGGPVSHTALSAMVAQVPGLYYWIGSACEDMWPSAPHVVHAIMQNNLNNSTSNSITPPSETTTNHENAKSSSQQPASSGRTAPQPVTTLTGHNLAEQTTVTFFDTLRKQPARMARFGNAMSVMQNMMPGFDATAALEAYDWAGLVSTTKLTVVDVGGGQNGDFAHALAASKHGDTILNKIVVQDLDLKKTETTDSKRSGIVEFMHHDFFSEQPVWLDADVYFLRMVLHDWSDGDCVRILRGLVPALERKKKGRILINDLVVPGPPPPSGLLPSATSDGNGPAGGGPPSRYIERQMRRQDLAMMAMFDSKERNEEQWGAVIKRADERLGVKSVTRCAGGMSPMAVIEVVLEQE